ncbi:limbic system-associated membrane protein [Condylostylus longicornis]|uniref:limbic system-associated membrane protein n=1 Tax=Condylostylus longicornis TaxID=2530218 RepID=UPI00244E2028|nr:limbic system-associated membrane protein [Condylostylus longicornis]
MMSCRFIKITYSFLTVYFSILCNNNFIRISSAEIAADPKFSEPIANVTVAVGREAVLTCLVQDLGSFKVAWLRVDTQTILTIQNHVITKNHRVGITYSEHKIWQLRIKDIRESDKGWYMCQINTDPMKSQTGYLDVVVPPDILDYPTSTDMVVREGSNVTLRCAANGSPEPTITWRREGGEPIELPNGDFVSSVEGPYLVIPRVKRQHMGAYLCIASNGVPPSVSKRIILIVHFPPMIFVQNQLIGAVEGKQTMLECQSEAFPKSINYWTREKGEIVPPGGQFTTNITEHSDYRVTMRLFIAPITQHELGSYRCVAKNSLGDTDGTIKLYRIPVSTVNSLDGHDGPKKGKKRIKTTTTEEYHHRTKNVDPSNNDDLENPGKRKDIMLGDNDDNIYDATSAASSNSLRWSTIGKNHLEIWQKRIITKTNLFGIFIITETLLKLLMSSISLSSLQLKSLSTSFIKFSTITSSSAKRISKEVFLFLSLLNLIYLRKFLNKLAEQFIRRGIFFWAKANNSLT